jgi:catechol 2,3-dioxygenase-like lactoylglutathione lyase family enzyme
MTIQRMEHVGIVVDDLAAATAFFVELGLKLQGEGPVEGGWLDRLRPLYFGRCGFTPTNAGLIAL